jgi:hypothetical protein
MTRVQTVPVSSIDRARGAIPGVWPNMHQAGSQFTFRNGTCHGSRRALESLVGSHYAQPGCCSASGARPVEHCGGHR